MDRAFDLAMSPWRRVLGWLIYLTGHGALWFAKRAAVAAWFAYEVGSVWAIADPESGVFPDLLSGIGTITGMICLRDTIRGIRGIEARVASGAATTPIPAPTMWALQVVGVAAAGHTIGIAPFMAIDFTPVAVSFWVLTCAMWATIAFVTDFRDGGTSVWQRVKERVAAWRAVAVPAGA